MYFAQFYTNSVIDKSKLIEACGDRAVLKLDGRERELTHVGHAADWAKKHGFEAFEIRRSDRNSFSDSFATTQKYIRKGTMYTIF